MKESATDLKSSAGEQGDSVTQIITFVNGVKKTFTGVLSKSIKQGQFTKFRTVDGRLIMINDENVLCVEVFEEAV